MKNSHKLFLIVTFVVVCFSLVNIPTAKATTVEEILAQIATLQAQIAQLQEQIAEIRGGEVEWCYDFNVNLRIEMRGEKVRALQTALQKEEFYKRTITGNFDEYTASAVVGFQEKYKEDVLTPWGLEHGTGYVGRTTRAKLNAIYGCGKVPSPKPYITVISPNGGEKWTSGQTYNVSWKSTGIDKITISVCFEAAFGYNCMELAGIPTIGINASLGKFSWKIDPNAPYIPGNNLKIRITDVSNSNLYDESNNYFSIVKIGPPSPSKIEVLSPNGGEKWEIDKTYTITWEHNLAGNFEAWIDLLKGGTYYGSIAGGNVRLSNAQDLTSYSWRVGDMKGGVGEGNDYQVRITYNDGNTGVMLTDISDNYFSIVSSIIQPTVGISSPNNGDIWQMGSAYNIIWFANNFTSYDKVNIILLDGRGGYSYYVIATDISAIAPSGTYAGTPIGKYSWVVPTTGIIPGETNSFKIYVGKYNPPAQSGDWEPLKIYAETGIYGYGNNFNIVSTSAAPIINDIRPSSIVQGQTLQVTLYGYNLSGATTTSGSCGLNPTALGGFILGNCNIQPLFVSVSITASNNATPGQRQFTITTPSGTSNAVTFTVLSSSVSRSIKVVSPNGGERWEIGRTYRIKWESQGIDSVNININNNSISGSGSTNYITPNGSAIKNVGYYDWTVSDKTIGPMLTGDQNRYRIFVYDSNYESTKIKDQSDNYFSIVVPSITLTSPNGGEEWVRGNSYEIKWDSFAVEEVNISVLNFAGSPPHGQGVTGIDASLGRYLFKVSDSPQGFIGLPAGDKYKVLIRGHTLDGIRVEDYSDNYFSIVAVTSACISTDNKLTEHIYVKGTTTYKGESKTDYCINSVKLKEYYCDTAMGGVSWLNELEYDCPSGCQDGACIKGITVTSPNGGEVWTSIDRVTDTLSGNENFRKDITWTGGSNPDSRTSVDAYLEQLINGQYVKIGRILPFAYGSIAWVVGVVSDPNCTYPDGVGNLPIPSDYCWLKTNMKIVSSGQYYVHLIDRTTKAEDRSDAPFNIVKRSITVISPNGGETWVKGNTYDITWKSSGVENVHIDVSRFGTPSHAYTLISNISASTGKYSWTIGAKWPDLLVADTYKIRVFPYPFTEDDTWQVYDQSDNYFSIVEAGLGLEGIGNQVAIVSDVISELIKKLKELAGE